MKIPEKQDEQSLIELDEQRYTEVKIPRTNKVVKVGWMKPETIKRISKLVLQSGFAEKEENVEHTLENFDRYSKFSSKYAALILLNGIKIPLFYWIYWRYLYYFKNYDYDQLMPIIQEAKKKVPLTGYLVAFMSAKQMMITSMTMTKKELESFQKEHTLE